MHFSPSFSILIRNQVALAISSLCTKLFINAPQVKNWQLRPKSILKPMSRPRPEDMGPNPSPRPKLSHPSKGKCSRHGRHYNHLRLDQLPTATYLPHVDPPTPKTFKANTSNLKPDSDLCRSNLGIFISKSHQQLDHNPASSIPRSLQAFSDDVVV